MHSFRATAFISAAFAAVAFGSPAVAQPATACFYQHANFQGDRICAGPGDARADLRFFNDIISSITVPAGTQVTVCEHIRFGGRCRTIDRNVPYVGDRWNDRISSIRVARRVADGGGDGPVGRNRVCFFEHADFRGRRLCARIGENLRRMPPGWNDRVSSFRIGSNANVQVCENNRYAGRCRVYSRDRAYVGDRWNDRISSFRVTRQGGGEPPDGPVGRNRACLFEHADFRGRRICGRVGEAFQRMPQGWNNRVSSLRIGQGVSVQVCENSRFRGRCRDYGRDRNYVGDRWNDRISSFRIVSNRPRPGTGDLARNEACFFEHADFRGRELCARVGDASRRMPPGWNDRISSVRLGRNAEVQVCERNRFGGRCRTYTRDRPYVGDRWNDRISSFRVVRAGAGEPQPEVVRNGVCFFEHADFRGQRFCVRRGESLRRMPPRWNDRISSLRIRGRAAVEVCEHDRFGGRCRPYNRDRRYVGDAWNDRISSVRVGGPGDFAGGPPPGPGPGPGFPPPGSADTHPHRICFFSGDKYRGRWFCDKPRNRVNRLPPQWNNEIESIRMFGNSTVKVCDSPNLTGKCTIYSRSNKRIGPEWQNRVSSYQILLP